MGAQASKANGESSAKDVIAVAVAPVPVVAASFTSGELSDKKLFSDTEEKIFNFYKNLLADEKLLNRKDRIDELDRRVTQLDSSLKLYHFPSAKWLTVEILIKKNHEMRDRLVDAWEKADEESA